MKAFTHSLQGSFERKTFWMFDRDSTYIIFSKVSREGFYWLTLFVLFAFDFLSLKSAITLVWIFFISFYFLHSSLILSIFTVSSEWLISRSGRVDPWAGEHLVQQEHSPWRQVRPQPLGHPAGHSLSYHQVGPLSFFNSLLISLFPIHDDLSASHKQLLS